MKPLLIAHVLSLCFFEMIQWNLPSAHLSGCDNEQKTSTSVSAFQGSQECLMLAKPNKKHMGKIFGENFRCGSDAKLTIATKPPVETRLSHFTNGKISEKLSIFHKVQQLWTGIYGFLCWWILLWCPRCIIKIFTQYLLPLRSV